MMLRMKSLLRKIMTLEVHYKKTPENADKEMKQNHLENLLCKVPIIQEKAFCSVLLMRQKLFDGFRPKSILEENSP